MRISTNTKTIYGISIPNFYNRRYLEIKNPVITQTRLKSNLKLASFLYEKLVQAYKTHLKEEQGYLPPLPSLK